LRRDKRAAGAGDGFRRPVRAQRLADCIGAVDRQLQLLSEEVGVGGSRCGSQRAEALADRAYGRGYLEAFMLSGLLCLIVSPMVLLIGRNRDAASPVAVPAE
jgi:hypothetical protein